MMAGALISVVRADCENAPDEELVSVVRVGVDTIIRFDDGSRLLFKTGELLNAVVDEQVLTELVESVLKKAAAALERERS